MNEKLKKLCIVLEFSWMKQSKPGKPLNITILQTGFTWRPPEDDDS
jgi:hypothetical protein